MNFWKFFLQIWRAVKNATCMFFIFFNFLTTFAKNLMKRPPAFIVDIKSSYKLLLSQKGLRSRNFWQWNDGPLNIFKNLHGNEFCLFSLNEKIIAMCHLMIHMKCIADIFFSENWCSLKQPLRNNGPLTFLQKTLWKKLSFFNINLWNSFYYLAKFYDLKPATTKMETLSI